MFFYSKGGFLGAGKGILVEDTMINEKGGNDDDDVPLVRAIHTKVIQT